MTLFRVRLRQWSTIIEYKKTMASGVENIGPALGQAPRCGGLKPVNGIRTPTNTDIINQ
jgi:hypothetical protein